MDYFINHLNDMSKKDMKRLLFFKFLVEKIFATENIRRILEVSDRVEDSLSFILSKKKYEPFILSPGATPSILKKYELAGIQGCIYKQKIYQGTWGSDILERNRIEDGPRIEDFDIVLAMGHSNYKRNCMYPLRDVRKIMGECAFFDREHPSKYYSSLYLDSVDLMNSEDSEPYDLLTDVIPEENLGYYLIKKK